MAKGFLCLVAAAFCLGACGDDVRYNQPVQSAVDDDTQQEDGGEALEEEGWTLSVYDHDCDGVSDDCEITYRSTPKAIEYAAADMDCDGVPDGDWCFFSRFDEQGHTILEAVDDDCDGEIDRVVYVQTGSMEEGLLESRDDFEGDGSFDHCSAQIYQGDEPQPGFWRDMSCEGVLDQCEGMFFDQQGRLIEHQYSKSFEGCGLDVCGFHKSTRVHSADGASFEECFYDNNCDDEPAHCHTVNLDANGNELSELSYDHHAPDRSVYKVRRYDELSRVTWLGSDWNHDTALPNLCVMFSYHNDTERITTISLDADCNGDADSVCYRAELDGQGQLVYATIYDGVDCTGPPADCEGRQYDQQGRLVKEFWDTDCDREEDRYCKSIEYDVQPPEGLIVPR